jgi:hypothetical protein
MATEPRRLSAPVISLIQQLARSGISQREGLRMFRQAGLRIRDATFRQVWNAVPEALRKEPMLNVMDRDARIPMSAMVVRQPDEQGRIPGVRQNYYISGTAVLRDRDTGLVIETTKRFGFMRRPSLADWVTRLEAALEEARQRGDYDFEIVHVHFHTVEARADAPDLRRG